MRLGEVLSLPLRRGWRRWNQTPEVHRDERGQGCVEMWKLPVLKGAYGNAEEGLFTRA